MISIWCDPNGKVWMVGNSGAEADTMEWNDLTLTCKVLDEAQEASYVALPKKRGDITFDGALFSAAPPTPPPPTPISVEDLVALLKAKGIILNGDLTKP